MAIALLDGTNAAIDVTIATVSIKAMAAAWTARMLRDFFEQTTFASGGWRARVPGMKQCLVSVAGFSSKGISMSDPLALFATQAPMASVYTADTSCSITGNFHYGSDEHSYVAAGNSGRVIAGESYGPVTTAWVIA